MFTNYLKIAFRNLVRNRSFTVLNLLSLIIGLFVAYVAISYIRFELGYDSFHRNAGSIYRLARTYRSQDYSIIGFARWDASTDKEQQLQLEFLKKATGVADAAQFVTSEVPVFIEAEGRKIQERNVLTTNTPQAFCALFTWALRQGSFQNFASGTNKVMLTATTARKLFGDEALSNPDVIQKRITVGSETYIIAAIIDDISKQSHFDFSMAVSQPRIPYWGSRMYVQTDNNADTERVTAAINGAIAAFNPNLVRDPLYKQHFLQPITAIHLHSTILYELKPPGNVLYLLLIGGFSLFISIITLFNYANLSLAIKSKQSKAIGVQKALGAHQTSIAIQFITEGILLALMALPFVAVLTAGCIPLFNNLMGVAIPANVFNDPLAVLALLLLALFTGALASSFTAVNLAGKKAVTLFKENLRSNQYQNFPIRKYLILSQFSILIGITSVSYFIIKQIKYVESKDLGFRKEGILYAYSSPGKQTLFQEKLRQVPGIKLVGNGSSFGIAPFNQVTYKLQGSDVVFDDARQLYLDPAALNAYGLKTTPLPSGRNRPATFTLVNRTAAEQIAAKEQLPVESVIGKTIITEPEYVSENGQIGLPFTVAGIFDDINVFSLHEKVEPYFITVVDSLRMDGRTIVWYDTTSTAATVARIRKLYAGLNEQRPLEIDYLDEQLAGLYKQDHQTASLLFCFNLIAIFLACIGIAGITIFLTVARTKEIGIRKVLGASALSIVQSATKEYVYLIGFALLISWPVAMYVINEWLKNFAYHITVQQLPFVVIGFFAFMLTALIVAIIAYKAALVNPANSLRSE
ncbi:ABC transporter permease [Spirosoma spitsbergense]|uniref:ABC transporter permease n=1 Tax=Spirosoma spitsbergense TaxID=431554 RepID=UPI000360CFC5|nr:ABC transporter permease [Spirosoma spitsbergense]